MKMKKPTSMATVIGRTCPRCFTMVDPLWYGWHITKCTSDKQDMAPSTTLMMDEAHMSKLVGSTCQEVSISLPASCTLSLAPDSQTIEEKSREENTQKSPEVSEYEVTQLRAEKQALADRVKDLELQLEGLESQLLAEKQGMAKTIKDLELNVEKLECELKLSKPAEGKAFWLVESLHGSSKEENGHINEAGKCNQLAETTTLEPKSLGSHEVSMEFRNDEIVSCDKEAKKVDNRDACSHPSNEGIEETIWTKGGDNREEIQLDRVVGFACTGGPISEEFLSQVDEFIESHNAFASTSRMQGSPLEPSVSANVGDPYQDIVAKTGSQDSTKQHCHNESAPTIVIHEEHHTAPRDALGTPFDISNEDSLNNCQADGHGGSKPNGVSVVKPSSPGLHLDAQGAALEMLFHALDQDTRTEVPQILCEGNSHSKQAHSHSSSSSSEAEGCVFRAKTGLRRIVLSDSESEGGNIRGNCEGDNHKDPCTENGVEIGVSQQPLRRRKQPKVVQISDMSDDDVCNGMSEQSSPKSAEGPIASVSNAEGGGVGGIEDREHTGVRRSKRLRMLKAQTKDPGIPSSRNKTHCLPVASSTLEETRGSFEGVQESSPEASENTLSREVEASLEVQGTPSSKKRVRRLVVVPMTDSEATSGSVEGSKKSQRVRKRLFEEIESKPAYGNNHPSDSEEEVDSEIGSDEDSLKDFVVTESEGTEESRSSDDDHHQTSSGSHSSREAFCDPKLMRDIKIRSYVWEIEPEMLATFAIDPELCLRALCAINRRQTEDEQKDKVSKYSNKRGFDKLHAGRGTRIAEFLTDGDPTGPVKKSIKDLKKLNAGDLRFCKMMAAKHSKQLFEIYTTAEDPHFPFA